MNGSDLVALRKGAGLKANELAALLDISAATLSNYENDKSPIPVKIVLATRYLCEKNGNVRVTPTDAMLAEAIRTIVLETVAQSPQLERAEG
jgi:transcriptional regulator with XRE-family HTH domain